MWVRKTPEEIAKERNTLWRRWSSLILAFFLGFGLSIAGMSDGRYGPHQPITSTGILVAVAVGLLAIIAAYLLQLRFGKPLFSHQCGQPYVSYSYKSMDCQICDTCQQVRPYDRQQACTCGGKLEDFDLWKWVDES
jgi:hypothetical protein